MTPEQERAGAELFAAGKSEREVAVALGVGTGSAHRLRVKLAARDQAADDPAPEITEPGPADAPVMLMTGQPGPAGQDDAAELAALAELRAGLVEQLETCSGRAESSLAAVQELEQQRTEVLASGGDAVALRPRIRDARADLDDWAKAAHLLSERLAAVDTRIAEINGRRELARLRAELDAAVAERDAVCVRSGERQRAAVLAVRDAAVDFTATFAEELAAGTRVEQLAWAVAAGAQEHGVPVADVPPAVSTALAVPGDANAGPALALVRATYRARAGDAGAVAVLLGEAFGWLPPSPEELAADRAVWEARAAAMAASVPAEPRQPWTQPGGGSVDLDEQGREIPPHPLDVYRSPAAGSYGSGFRTGW